MPVFLQVASSIFSLNIQKMRVYQKQENSIPVTRKALQNDFSQLRGSMKVGQPAPTKLQAPHTRTFRIFPMTIYQFSICILRKRTYCYRFFTLLSNQSHQKFNVESLNSTL